MAHPTVVVLDLDGTCIYTDTFHELLTLALKQKPLLVIQSLWWLLVCGRAEAKERLVKSIDLDPSLLPYNEELLQEAYGLAQRGFYLVLATGTHRLLAEKIARYLGIFEEVIATERGINMTGDNKARCLVDRFGQRNFIYVGDSKKDIHVWAKASDVWVVNPKAFVTSKGRKLAQHPSRYRIFPRMFSRLDSFFKSLEPKLWLYNLAILVPVFFMGIPIKVELIAALIMLNLITSGSSIIQHLVKIEHFRMEQDGNPFSKGHLSLTTGFIAGPLLLISGLCIASYLNVALLMLLILWSALLIQDSGAFSKVSRFIAPIIVGCFIF